MEKLTSDQASEHSPAAAVSKRDRAKIVYKNLCALCELQRGQLSQSIHNQLALVDLELWSGDPAKSALGDVDHFCDVMIEGRRLGKVEQAINKGIKDQRAEMDKQRLLAQNLTSQSH